MSESQPPREPTMEEILASIRRIISEEEAAVQAAGTTAPAQGEAAVDFTEILELTHALPPEAAPTAPAAALAGRGDIGLEALVRSLLEPHLKAWLDAHLPEIVEKMVAAEIARIAQSRTDQPG